MANTHTYDWVENKLGYKYDFIECIICGEKTRRILNSGKAKKNKKTCGKQYCTNRYALINPDKKIYNIKCDSCNSEFQSLRKNAKFCSDICRKKRYKLKCVICSSSFRADRPEIRTCSHECRWELNKRKSIMLTCKECGEEFERPTFTVANPDDVFCSEKCNNIYHVQKNYGTFNRYGEDWYYIKKYILEYYKHTCQRCDSKSDESLHVHHCIPFQYFNNKEEANNTENLIPLCKKCHTEVHKENKEWYKSTFGEEKI